MRTGQKTQPPCVRGAVALLSFAFSFGLISMLGCGSGSSQAKAFVTILPGPLAVGVGGSLQIFAEASPANVTWTLTPVSGCSGSACGTLTSPTVASITYVSPTTLSGNSATFTITATSTTDTTLSSTETFTIFPVAVQISATAGSTVQPLTSGGFTAVVAGDPTPNGVSWSLSGPNCSGVGLAYSNCGTLTDSVTSTVSSVTFNAPAAPSLEQVMLTATSVQFPNASASFPISVPKFNIFLYSATTLPAAIAGQAYSATVQVSGNKPPYGFTATNLPSWATITPTSPATGTSFTISGTPPIGTQGLSYVFINVADSDSPQATASKAYTLSVYPAAATGDNLLTGSYAFHATGWLDTTNTGSSTSTAFQGVSYVGSFTADGQGNITGGEIDINNFQTGLTSYTGLSGSYNIQYATDANGNQLAGFQSGYITLLPPGNVKPLTLAVTFRGIQHAKPSALATDVASFGDFIEFDDTTGIGVAVTANSSGQRTSGTLALQQNIPATMNTPAQTVLNQASSPFNGSFAFGMNGNTSAASTAPVSGNTIVCFSTAPPTCGPISLAGVLTIGADGSVTNGEEDVMIASNYFAATPNGLTGSLASSGATDASGRITASIVNSQRYTITGSSTSTTVVWPSNFIVYAIDPQHFYFMSSDSYLTTAQVIGSATMQLPTMGLTTANSMALISTTTSTQYFTNGSGPNGKVRDSIQVFLPSTSSASCPGSYALGGPQYQDLSGTITTAIVGSVGVYCNTLSANGRLQPSTTSIGTGEPILYLYDTNQGYGTQWNAGNGPGTWMALNRTANYLNAGNYSGSMFNSTSILSPLEVAILTMPKGGAAYNANSLPVPFTGTDFTQFPSVAGEYMNSGAITLSVPFTGTIQDNYGASASGTTVNGILYNHGVPTASSTVQAITFAPLNTFQGCIGSFGFIVSATSFMCFANVDQFATAHLYQQ